MKKDYGFTKDIMIWDIETTNTWPYMEHSYMTEFACVILDSQTLELKDSLHTYITVPKESYDNAPDVIKKMHANVWPIILGEQKPPDGRIVINQDQVVGLIKYKFGKDLELGRFKILAWNDRFDFAWLMHYFFKAGEGKLWWDMTYDCADMKSYVEGVFIANGKTSIKINSKYAYELFEVEQKGGPTHNALEDCINEAEIFRKFCDMAK